MFVITITIRHSLGLGNRRSSSSSSKLFGLSLAAKMTEDEE